MIRILSVSVYKEGRSLRLYYESFKDKKFESFGVMRKWCEKLEREWSEMMGYDCKAYAVRRGRPEVEINMMTVMMNTAKVLKLPLDKIMSSSRKRELADARKMVCMILSDADYDPMDIERGLPYFKNRVIYDYIKKMDNRISTEPGYKDYYNDVRDKVMQMTKFK